MTSPPAVAPTRSELFDLLGITEIYQIPRTRLKYILMSSVPGVAELLKEGARYRELMCIDLRDIKDTRVFKFYGARDKMFKIDSMALEAVEDPGDEHNGSFYAGVVVTKDESGVKFSKTPLASVRVVQITEPKKVNGVFGWALVDNDDGHVWLLLGSKGLNTQTLAQFHPGFVFNYSPKEQ